MADNSTGLPVQTISGQFVQTKLVDSGGSNVAAVSAAGAVKVDGSAVTQPVSGTVTADTELPAAAGLADNTANPTTSVIGDMLHGFDGTTWDRIRTTDAYDGNGALTTTGALTVGVGPGYARRFNPANLGTANNSASTVDVNGAGTLGIEISTTTTGTFVIETTVDGTTWVPAMTYDLGGLAFVTNTSLTPTTGKIYIVSVNGMRQARLRTNATLGATVAHALTLSLGDVITTSPSGGTAGSVNLTQVGGSAIAIGQAAMAASLPVVIASNQSAIAVDSELPAAAALADATANPTVPAVGGFLMGYNGTTWDRLRSTTANGLAVDVTRVTGTVTVDTELTAVATLADATANPTITNISALNSVFNGTTWDRVRSVANAQDTTGTGIQAAGILGQLDDTSTSAVTENQFAPVRISTRRALLVEGVASGNNINVNLAASAATVTVDTELTAVAALADATANPTITNISAFASVFNGTTWDRARGAATLADALANPGTGLAQGQNFLMGYNGTTWDRIRTANTGRLQVDVISGGGTTSTVIVDNAAFTDGTTSVNMSGYIFDEVAGTALTENDAAAARIDAKRAQVFVVEDATTRGQRQAVSAAGAASMNITQIGGSTQSATVPLPVRMTDGTAFYTNTGQTAGTSVFSRINDGTTTAGVIVGTTALKVDIASRQGAVDSATNPLFVRLTDGTTAYSAASSAPTSPQFSTVTSAALGAGSNVDLETADIGGTTGQLMGVDVASTVPIKVIISTVTAATPTTRVVLFAQSYSGLQWRTPYKTFITRSAGAGNRFRVNITNKDASVAADVYATIFYDQV